MRRPGLGLWCGQPSGNCVDAHFDLAAGQCLQAPKPDLTACASSCWVA